MCRKADNSNTPLKSGEEGGVGSQECHKVAKLDILHVIAWGPEAEVADTVVDRARASRRGMIMIVNDQTPAL